MSIPRPTPPPYPWADAFFSVGITGTNGKTSTTRLIASVLRAAGHPTLSLDTVGAAIDDAPLPLPVTLRDFYAMLHGARARGVRHAALELTSRALADGYAGRWRFDLGVFTNLSPDHHQTHGTFEHYLAAKAQLFVHLGAGRAAVLNAGDPSALLLHRAIPADVVRRWFHAPSRGPRLSDHVDLAASRVAVDLSGTSIELAGSAWAERLGGRLRVQMVGEVFAENALAAAAAGLAAGLEGRDVARGLSLCPGVPGRFEVLARDPIVVVDYAHSPDALARTCDTARTLSDGRVIVVFGAGGESSPEKREPMGEAVGARADLAIVTNDDPRGEDPAAIAAALRVGLQRGGRSSVDIELDRALAIERAITGARRGDVVLIAGRGHATHMRVGDEVRELSDVDTVRALVAMPSGAS